MCGLAGVAGNGLVLQDINIFKDILYVSSLRGRDSTGLVVANTNKPGVHYTISKSMMASPEYIEHMTYKGSPLSVQGQNLMMGHCRWGTIGDKTIENAHPFEMSQIIGMHNGTLDDAEYIYGKGTDSEEMFKDMNSRGIKTVLEGLDWRSAYAITVYDKKTRKLYMARNSQRTLCVGFDKRNGVMFWASEAQMLYLAAARNKTTLDVYYLAAYRLYEIDINDIKPDNVAPWTSIELDVQKWEAPLAGLHTYGTKKKHTVSPKGNVITLEGDEMYDEDVWKEYIQ